METSFASLKKQLTMAIEIIRKGRASQITLLATPPPKADDRRLRLRLTVEPPFKAKLEEAGLDATSIPLTPPRVRLKLWALMQRQMKSVAKDFGLSYVQVPQEAQDEDGFLKEEYWAGDVSHANRAYGDLFLSKIERWLWANPALEAVK